MKRVPIIRLRFNEASTYYPTIEILRLSNEASTYYPPIEI